MTVKYYPNKITMLKDLDSKVKGLDINKSAFLNAFGFVKTDGSQFLAISPADFVKKFNGEFGDVVVLQNTRTTVGRGFMINYLDDVEIKSESKEEEVEVAVSEVETSKEVVGSDTETPDFDHALSLQEGKSKKEAKDALEAYARLYNVELAKNKTYENMMKDFKESF